MPGLRREELAQLAGISVDYYTRMEQGRATNASDSILDALASALRLDAAERAHLYRLARPMRVEAPSEEVRPALRWLLDALQGVPAMVLGRRLDVPRVEPAGRGAHHGLPRAAEHGALHVHRPGRA